MERLKEKKIKKNKNLSKKMLLQVSARFKQMSVIMQSKQRRPTSLKYKTRGSDFPPGPTGLTARWADCGVSGCPPAPTSE